MIPNPFDSGKLEKMMVVAHKPQSSNDERPELSDKEEDKYMVQVNPESYTLNYQIDYDCRSAHGNSGSEAKYAQTLPQVLEFEFLFDGTGVIPDRAGPLDNVPIAGALADVLSDDGDEYNVSDELQKFAKVVYEYSGDEHRPRQIRITWGTLLFDCVLKSLSIDYKLFKPDGVPLRAVVNATFDGSISDVFREKKEKNNSPDLTHQLNVVAGDTLPLLTQQVYQKPKYYMEVAKKNKLYNFRKLEAGSTISFPPVDKKST